MEKKIVLLKDLDEKTQFPVVDLLKSSGDRLGCVATALINWAVKLDIVDQSGFSNLGEMALFYEMELEKDEKDGVKPQRAIQVINEFVKGKSLEKYAGRADKVPWEIVLTLLGNDFVGMALTATREEGNGHCDIFFKDSSGRVFYNAFEINEEELAEILFNHKDNILMFARNLKKYPQFFMKRDDMVNLTFTLSDEQKYMLSDYEVALCEKNLLDIFVRFPNLLTSQIFEDKEQALKMLGLLHPSTQLM